ncbi:nuclease-related domain-containing protein [Robertmurraya korlensis]|uniref:nuclease-related domain-containing protein n=1 Tax=Robertmurraya korlensis TaxID=519977 RepID=UPI000825A929|nr:nuclease-related domain-containing protein [Robertmurraya korlensis]
MIYKSRSESSELQILEALNTRMGLIEKDKQHYLVLRKGYDGEVLFDSMTEKLDCDCLILNDLLLRINHTVFQIDALMITFDTVYFFEVKNYEGDYYYENEKWYVMNKTEVTNPLTQLSRSETLLRQLLQQLGCHSPINAKVIFINPEFSLFQAPLGKPLILPTQVKRFLKRLNTTSAKLSEKHRIIAEKLVSLHLTESPNTQLPSYLYDEVRKGITSHKCTSFFISVKGRSCLCHECGNKENVSLALMRCVKEYKLLFPKRRVTTIEIYLWCNEIIPKQRVRRFLEKNFKIVGIHQWAYYD